jgi:cell division protein FtsI/penicillin-binding protein 2/cell division protein FtsW (lipid II flippase)
MAVTRSWTMPGTSPVVVGVPRHRTSLRLAWLVAASLLVATGLWFVYQAKLQRMSGGAVLNLNVVTSADELLPVLEFFPNRAELAPRIFEYLERARPLRHTGALTAVIPRRQFASLKPLIAVRSPAEFRAQLVRSALLYFAGFYVVALIWRLTRFRGDAALLPALQLLTGFGFLLMVSMRDPLRDTLEFHKFAVGVFLGSLLLALPAFPIFNYRRLTGWCYTPLFAALGLFGLLMAFGRGPAGNDAKVNLGMFQPVELIKILLVMFLAGYFTRQWERLRDLREKRVPGGRVARAEHVVPVLVATGISLVLFFVLKDLGPALVTLFVFLAVFTVARGKPALGIAALILMVAAVATGYRLGTPHTVAQRIDMWLSPWDNDVHGGDQLAHALWAFATGGPTGSGPGWGDPGVIPAGNTDLVLPALGEEWGFVGVAAVFMLFGVLIWRGLRAAQRADTTYGLFLATGLTMLIACEMLLVTAGVLGALPLSGVVSPFLSSGNTAMVANFLVFALLAGIGNVAIGNPAIANPAIANPENAIQPQALRAPVGRLKLVLAGAGAILLGFAFHYQVLRDSGYLARDAHAFEEDKVKRPQHNPRINSLAREIPRGTIYDRNGVPLATSNWQELERHRDAYSALGVSLETADSRFDSRHYPFGAATVHLTGDLRTGENFHASNASLVEHDANGRLQGYEYAELAPLIRYRHHPHNAGVARILARDRALRLTVDIRLQVRAKEILERHLRQAGVANGALVVMEAGTGDVLAMVSTPSTSPPAVRAAAPTPDELLDRARYGQYPPGSTFKLVTAMAALRGDPGLTRRTYQCRPLGDGRCGNTIAGWNRAIKDDIGDRAHGTLDMERAITVSCNAYFAQLGVHDVGSKALAEMADRLGFSTGDPAALRQALPFAAYGQGPVLVTPFKMARVAAAIAAGGRMPQGRWIAGEGNPRQDAPLDVLAEAQARFLAGAMRRVVTEGTARRVMAGSAVEFAGKTGTAQLDRGMPHAWFTGFAPFDGTPERRLAFAVVVENGGYGGRVAAPIAREVMEAAKGLGLL